MCRLVCLKEIKEFFRARSIPLIYKKYIPKRSLLMKFCRKLTHRSLKVITKNERDYLQRALWLTMRSNITRIYFKIAYVYNTNIKNLMLKVLLIKLKVSLLRTLGIIIRDFKNRNITSEALIQVAQLINKS